MGVSRKEDVPQYLDFVQKVDPKIAFPYDFVPGEEDRARALANTLDQHSHTAKFIEIGTEFQF